MTFLTGVALVAPIHDGFVLALVLAAWLVVVGVIRFVYWFLRYLDRRDAAAFREQVFLVQQEMECRARAPASTAGEDTQ